MKKVLLASTVAMAVIAYDNDSTATVLVQGADGEPLRINKADFDADQADGGKGEYTEWQGDPPELPTAPNVGDVPPMAAPSAPDFTDHSEGDSNIDPLKNAVAPTHHGENARLVVKEGKSYYVVDGQGVKLTTEQLGGIDNKFASDDLAWKAVKDLPH